MKMNLLFCEKSAGTVLLLFVCVFLAGCRDATQTSSAMAPTIKPGEKVTVDFVAYSLTMPKRWDVVAFAPPGRTDQVWTMRIVGLPGESVSFASNGITVGGRALVLPAPITNVSYVSLDKLNLPTSTPSPYIVPLSSYFVLGDNSANANDSRFWGALPRTNIIGKVRGK